MAFQRVMKEGEVFLVTDLSGDIPRPWSGGGGGDGDGGAGSGNRPAAPDARAGYGLYAWDTRFLNRLELRLNGRVPEVVSSVASGGYVCKILLRDAATAVQRAGGGMPGATAGERMGGADAHEPPTAPVGVERTRFVSRALHERVVVQNRDDRPVSLELTFDLDSDFEDIFEVRGRPRKARGRKSPPAVVGDRLVFAYVGLDGLERRTEIRFEPAPDHIEGGRAVFRLGLAGRGSACLSLTITPAVGPEMRREALSEALSEAPPDDFDTRLAELGRSYEAWAREGPCVCSDCEGFNRMAARGIADLRLLMTDFGCGEFPCAGVPWFVAPFGRDSLITALFLLPARPDVAAAVLRTLAGYQGREVNPSRDEEPGKIPHEIRYGEMARLGETPFAAYYGSVDSTPLFLMLACSYYAWTGDAGALRELLPAIKGALRWLGSHGDKDGDGFVEYIRSAPGGLANQGWKDSREGIRHADGGSVAGPVALCEVQGYAYRARRDSAVMLVGLGEIARPEAGHLLDEAEALKRKFNEAFWMADDRYLALCLDGAKKQVRPVTSNPAHCLWTGIVDERKAREVAKRLVAPDMFSGWGIRTVSDQEPTYSPASYHNGSVWPHDTAIAALGLRRYGFRREACGIVEGLVDAAGYFEYHRLPELFCGLPRRGYPRQGRPAQGRRGQERGPVQHPAACSPQAWASATPLALLQVLLHPLPDAPNGTLLLDPCLPPRLGVLRVGSLRFAGHRFDLEVTRSRGTGGYVVATTPRDPGFRVLLRRHRRGTRPT